jgi:hypothetical protein
MLEGSSPRREGSFAHRKGLSGRPGGLLSGGSDPLAVWKGSATVERDLPARERVLPAVELVFAGAETTLPARIGRSRWDGMDETPVRRGANGRLWTDKKRTKNFMKSLLQLWKL